ncbi:MAG: hypothetical protein KatS3mg065_0651 [Chloroflexota bacterium]|nr:MAG: hypothetical protein KatS3mg065_0651 [Chloroflexota bacterium]
MRGDVGTLRRHLEALGRHAPGLVGLYRVLAEREIGVAVRRGALDGERAARLREVLGEVAARRGECRQVAGGGAGGRPARGGSGSARGPTRRAWPACGLVGPGWPRRSPPAPGRRLRGPAWLARGRLPAGRRGFRRQREHSGSATPACGRDAAAAPLVAGCTPPAAIRGTNAPAGPDRGGGGFEGRAGLRALLATGRQRWAVDSGRPPVTAGPDRAADRWLGAHPIAVHRGAGGLGAGAVPFVRSRR